MADQIRGYRVDQVFIDELAAQTEPAWMAQRRIQPLPAWVDPLQQPCSVSPALAGFQCRHHLGHWGPHEPEGAAR